MATPQPARPAGLCKAEARSQLLSLFSARHTSPPRKPRPISPLAVKQPSYRQVVVALPSPAATPKIPGTPSADRPSSTMSSQSRDPDYFQDVTDLTSDVMPESHAKKSLRASTKRKSEGTNMRTSINQRNSPHVKIKKETERMRIRADIAARTVVRSNNFLCAHRHLFLPVLPEHNTVSRLLLNNADPPPLIPFRQLESQPEGIKATLKPYQLTGLSFLIHMYENGASAILGDEMGLGKTLQTLSLFQYLKIHDPLPPGQARPSLVVCPLSVLSSWVNEAAKWTPDLKMMRFHGNATVRNTLKAQALDRRASQFANFDGPPDFVVTTYETFASEKSWFQSAFVWRYCVLDEGHKIKNESTLLAKALQSFSPEYRLVLTGTPVQNNLQEMWALLHWLYPDTFDIRTKDEFRNSFDLNKGKVSEDFMQNARRLLEIVMLRRTKTSPGVNLGLPPKEEIILYLPMTITQRELYMNVLTQTDESVLQGIFKGSIEGEKLDQRIEKAEQNLIKGEPTDADSMQLLKKDQDSVSTSTKTAWQRLMNLLVGLRQVCIHPYMIAQGMPETYSMGDHIRTASAKYIALDKLLTEYVLKRKEKVLIFSYFTGALDWAEDLLTLKAGGFNGEKKKFGFSRLDGGTCKARRNLAIRTFNNADSENKIMMISTRAGGLGLNLTAATVVVFMDFDWNPQIDLQAQARAHRIGQTRPVTIYKLCTQGTVEEQMLDRINKKLYLSVKITESMQDRYGKQDEDASAIKHEMIKSEYNSDSDVPDIGVSQLQSLIRRGAATIVQSDDQIDMEPWTFDEMISSCREKAVETTKQEETDAEAEAEWLAKAAKVECAVLDGVKINRSKRSSQFQPEILDNRADRRVGKNTTVLIDGYQVSKASVGCADWEAVPTLAGKNPALAEYKRAKVAEIRHQTHCQICSVEQNQVPLADCVGCPRAYHLPCLGPGVAKIHMTGLRCPQHYCADCSRPTQDVGGMLYRCRSCPSAFCEDCLDFDLIKLVGETHDEFAKLDYPPITQAYYIDCAACLGHEDSGVKFDGHEEDKKRKREELESEDSDVIEYEPVPVRKKAKRESSKRVKTEMKRQTMMKHNHLRKMPRSEDLRMDAHQHEVIDLDDC